MTWDQLIPWLLVSDLFSGPAIRPAQSPSTSPAATVANVPFAFDGPPAPAPPDVISRDASGRATLRAVRLTSPIRLDGALDEAVYETVPPISDFIQQEPQEGAPATEKTEVWLLFDDDRVYVSFRCWESQPERLIANEMRRDNNNIFQNDHVAFLFDTFYDRRNGFDFVVNAIGGRMDGQITNERQSNGDWNPIWDVRGRAVRAAAGPSRSPSRSSRSATGRAAPRSGASTPGASTAGRTRCRTSRAFRAAGRDGHLPGLAGRHAGRPGGAARDRGTSRSSPTPSRA